MTEVLWRVLGSLGKILGVVCVVGGGTAFGWYLAYLSAKRITLLQEMQQIMLLLYGDIEYAGADLTENLERLGETSEYFSCFLGQVCREMKCYSGRMLWEIWESNMQSITGYRLLKKEDLQLWMALGQDLGRTDRQTQLQTLRLHQNRLDSLIAQARQEYAGKAKISRVIGVTVGLFTAIIFL